MATFIQKHPEERTFKQFTPTQAQNYATNRGGYQEKFLQVILDHHESTGGAFGTLVDVGCGPGKTSTRPLAKRFDNAYGIDPSPEMINIAKLLSAESPHEGTASGKKIQFLVGSSEDLSDSIGDPQIKVDLLTAGTAAHWFDMVGFWPSAARVLNKGGTVALWVATSIWPHPCTPNYVDVREAFVRLEREYLAPYELPGNRISRTAYEDLLLPWDVNPPVESFSRSGFTRLDWDRDGRLSDGEHFFLGDKTITLGNIGKSLGTTSMMIRWGDAHPQLAGTDEDLIVKMIKELREILGGDEIVIGTSCTLLLFKKE